MPLFNAMGLWQVAKSAANRVCVGKFALMSCAGLCCHLYVRCLCTYRQLMSLNGRQWISGNLAEQQSAARATATSVIEMFYFNSSESRRRRSKRSNLRRRWGDGKTGVNWLNRRAEQSA